MDSWTIFKPRASSLRRQVSYDSVTENQCDGNSDLKKVFKVSKEKCLAFLGTQLVNMPCPNGQLGQRSSRNLRALGGPRAPRAL